MYQSLGRAIDAEKDALAQRIVDQQWANNPSFDTRYGAVGHGKCVQDVKYNLSYLSQAIAANSPALFVSYVDWIQVLFEGLKIPTAELIESLEITRQLLQYRFPEANILIDNFIDPGIKQLSNPPKIIPCFFDDNQSLSALGKDYLHSLLHSSRNVSSQLILDAVAQGVSVKDIYLHVFQPCQHELGRLWQINQISVAQEHYCTAVTQLIMSQLYVHIFNTPKNGRILVATCVGSELHEIGMRMVADFFEMNGWDTYYLGSNTPTASIIQTLTERKADILAISATMTFHIKLVENLIKQVRTIDTKKQIKILTGGYPFNIETELWRQVGADGYAANAEQAIVVANALMAINNK
jgi:MerR family transcriptional regulator, light-induced transcriptional regulator